MKTERLLQIKGAAIFLFEILLFFLIIAPIFVNIENGRFYYSTISNPISSEATLDFGRPVNLGFIFFSLFFLLIGFKRLKNIKLRVVTLPLVYSSLVLFISILFRLPVSATLAFLAFLLIWIYDFISSMVLTDYLKGKKLVARTTYILTLIYILSYVINGIPIDGHFAKYVLTIQIYQAFVTYPSILALLLLLVCLRIYVNQYRLSFLVILDYLAFVVLLIPIVAIAKRASIFELIIVFGACLFFKSDDGKKSLIKYVMCFLLIASVILISFKSKLFDYSSYEARIETLSNAQNVVTTSTINSVVTTSTINSVVTTSTINSEIQTKVSSFCKGADGTWGGYSSMFLDFYSRCGNFGLLIFLIYTILISVILLSLGLLISKRKESKSTVFNVKVATLSIILITVLQCVVNSHTLLPWYLTSLIVSMIGLEEL
jgi:hypothetical protein